MGKYLLDGEGDLGRSTTVCSPVFKRIYGGQAAHTSPRRRLQALTAPAKTCLLTIKISLLCGYLTETTSGIIKLVLLHKAAKFGLSINFLFFKE